MPTRDESLPDGTPCWVDVLVTDPAAARDFYSGLFGWDIQDGPPEAGGYLMCLLNGRPVAAISPKPEGNPFPNVWATYLAAGDLDLTVARAKEAGGTFMMEPTDVAAAGRIAFGMDPAGAPYGLWQAGDHKGVGIYDEPGALAWNELMTRDYEGAKAFYGSVFDFEYAELGDGQNFQYSTITRGDGEVVAGIGAMGAEVPADKAPEWVTYFNVADADVTATRAAELGATLECQPFDSPFGRMAVVRGPQGETFSIIQTPSVDDGVEAGLEG